MVCKGEIPWTSAEPVRPLMTSATSFDIVTVRRDSLSLRRPRALSVSDYAAPAQGPSNGNRAYHLVDSTGEAQAWVDSITAVLETQRPS